MAVFLLIGELPQGEMTHSRQSYLKFGFSTLIFGNKLIMGCYIYLQLSSHTGEMAHSRRRYLKFGISSLFLQYLGDELIFGCCPPHSQASTRGDGALKTKLLEVWLFYTFTFAIFLERVDHGLLHLLAAELFYTFTFGNELL